MYTNAYISNVSSQLNRLLVFKQVFNEYIHTCEKIIHGKCLASESTKTLHSYFIRNLARFKPFVDEFRSMSAPEEYEEMHAEIMDGVKQYEKAITEIMFAMKGTHLDQRQFKIGVSEQERALANINFSYFDSIRYNVGA